jgi:hypothetical protein
LEFGGAFSQKTNQEKYGGVFVVHEVKFDRKRRVMGS